MGAPRRRIEADVSIMRKILLVAIFIAVVLIALFMACPKPTPGKPVPAAAPVDSTTLQAQD